MKSPFLLLLIFLFLFSCSKEEDNEYDPYLKGSIIGYAMLTNQYGNLLDDHSGITVYTEPGKKFSAKTDINGRYEIKDVPTGTYNLSFEKEGFGSMWYPEVHHLGGKPTILGMPGPELWFWNRVVLHENITLQISDMVIFQENRIRAYVNLSGTPDLEGLYVRFYFSASDGFSVNDAVYTLDDKVYEGSGYFDYMSELPFESGTTFYCKAALLTKGANIILAEGIYAQEIDNYTDETLGTTIYPNLTDESEQYVFVKP